MKTNRKMMAVPVEKRAGRRTAVKRRPKTVQKTNPADYYKEGKGKSIFAKKLAQYRFLIYTDLETDDMAFLVMFTAWVKANEHFFDCRNSFPIYGFIVGETQNKRVKAQRAREFLQQFAEIMSWDDSEHHLYNGYNTAGKHVWFDGESDKSFDNEKDLLGNPVTVEGDKSFNDEKDLLGNPEAVEDPDYPDPELFVDTIDELMKVKPDNIFIFYLKPIRLFQAFQDRPEVAEYLQRVPGAIYGSWNVRCVLEESPKLTEAIMHFMNRSERDAPLLYTESYLAMGDDNTMNTDNAPRLFRKMDEAEDEELAVMIKDTMYKWNDNLHQRLTCRLSGMPEFDDTDFDDYESFTQTCAKLPEGHAKALNTTIKVVDSILKYQGQQFVFADPLAMIAVLIGNGTLKETPFRLQRSTIKYNKFAEITADESSNTWVLLPKGDLTVRHTERAKKLLENMLIAAFTLTSDYE